ncbi:uncharacterized protein LOC144443197 isoform X2 [Glandiceps talaboti]
MMSTVGTTRANTRSSNAREKAASKSSTHNTNNATVPPGKQNIHPTADQLRMAQIITSDDPETLKKIQQVQDVTGKSQDEVMVALHDHDDDPAKAINFLLENDSFNQVEWQTTGRKKKGRNQPAVQRNIDTSIPTKDRDNKDKDRDRDRGSREREPREKDHRDGSSSRGRGRGRDGPPPRMRGRGRENGSLSDKNERNRQNGEFGGRGRGSRDRDDRWNRDDVRPGGRYGQMNGPSRRGRGPRMGTFNSSDFNKGPREFVNSKLEESNVWTNPPDNAPAGNTTTETGTWGETIHKTEDWGSGHKTEEWGAEGDWGGDLTESKVFTASLNPAPNASQSPALPVPDTTSNLSNSINISALLQKPTDPSGQASGDGVASGRQTSLVLGQLTDIKVHPVSEPLKSQVGLGPAAVGLPSQSPSMGSTAVGGLPSQSQSLGSTSVGGLPNQASSLGSSNVGGLPSQAPSLGSNTVGGPMGPVSMGSSSVVVGSTAATVGSMSAGMPSQPSISQTMSVPQQQRGQQVKPQRKKMPPPSKIPASAVEMPMSAYSSSLGNLDVQFGALEFGSDVGDFSSTNDSVAISSTTNTLLSSGAVSVSEVSSGASHLSSYVSKPSDTYGGAMMSSSMLSTTSVTTTTSTPIVSSLEQSSRTTYSQPSPTSQSKALQPDPLSLPSQTGLSQSNSILVSSQRTPQPSTLDAVRSVTVASSSSSLTSSMTASQPGTAALSQTGPQSSGLSSLGSHSHSTNLPSTLASGNSNLMSSSNLSSHGSLSQSSHAGLGSSSHASTFPSTTTHNSHPSSSLSGSGHPSSSLSGSGPHSSLPSSSMAADKLSALNSVKESALDSHHVHQSQSSLGPSSLGPASSSHSVSYTTSSISSSTTMPTNVSAALGFSTTTTSSASSKANTQSTSTSSKAALNLPPGMPPLLNQLAAGHQYIMAPGLLPAYHQPMYNYEDLQLLQRMPMGYPYDMQQFQPNTTMTTDRSGASLGNVQYSVTEAAKFSRTDASSPIVTSVTSQQQQQQQQQPGQGSHHQQQQTQQPFLNPTLPPGYGYGGLAYYPGAAGVVPGMQYGPAMFPAVSVAPSTRSQQGSSAPHSGFQQPGAYGQHASHGTYGTGYDELTQTADFSKGGYQTASQTQSKGTGATVSVTSANSAATDITGSAYGSKTHTQTFDKQGFHAGTPPPFNLALPSGGQGGSLNPATGYATTPPQYVPMMAHPHQHQHQHQHHSQMLPHQMHSDGPQGASSQRSQGGSSQGKQGGTKQTYSSPYWGTN